MDIEVWVESLMGWMPQTPSDLKAWSRDFLPITSTLLGLVYAGLTYWLQGGFSRLEYSKDMLETLLTAQGRVILDLLVGASLVALFGMVGAFPLVSAAFWVMALVLVLDCLKVIAEQGYVETLSTKKFIPPHYGKIRRFLRQLRNAGIRGWARPSVLVGATVAIPLWVAGSIPFQISPQSAAVFLVAATALSLFEIRGLIVAAFWARKELDLRLSQANERAKSTMDSPPEPWDQKQRDVAHLIIRNDLDALGVMPWHRNAQLSKQEWTSRVLTSVPVLEHEPWVQEEGNLHLNLVIPYLQDDEVTRAFIFHWTKLILTTLGDSRASVSPIALSYWRVDSPGEKVHIALFRTPRSTLTTLLSMNLDAKSFCSKLPGRFLAEGIW